jgi:DNA repair exonuclease SbcCD ATPase subunit
MSDQEMDARFDKLATIIKSDVTALRSEVSGFRSEIRSEIKAEGEITRRHFDVVAEGLRAEIKVIADGHLALRDDVAGLKAAQERLEGRQERLETRQLALEHRQGKLEGGQHALVTEVRLMAVRLPA